METWFTLLQLKRFLSPKADLLSFLPGWKDKAGAVIETHSSENARTNGKLSMCLLTEINLEWFLGLTFNIELNTVLPHSFTVLMPDLHFLSRFLLLLLPLSCM